MAGAPTTRSRPRGARRAGYAIGALVNAAILVGATVWPGWDVLPFLTEDTDQVIGWIAASLVVGIVVNLVYLVADPPALRALGDLVTAGVGLAVTIRLLQVFPFDFGEAGFDWALVVRILLIVGVAGTAIGVVVAVVTLLRLLITGAAGPGR